MIPQNLVSHTILFASANMYFHTQIALSCQNVLYALYFYFVYIVEEILINWHWKERNHLQKKIQKY